MLERWKYWMDGKKCRLVAGWWNCAVVGRCRIVGCFEGEVERKLRDAFGKAIPGQGLWTAAGGS